MSVDPLRDSLRAIWVSAAPAWGQACRLRRRAGHAVADAMLAAAGVRAGERVLELACGPGGVGMAAAEAVRPDGAVFSPASRRR